MHTWRTIAMHTNLRLTLGTGSWIISVWYKLACIAFSPISYQIFTTSHNTNLATIHSQVTIGSCLMEYEYKLLCQFTTTVGGTKCYLWLKQSQSNSHMITSESLSLWNYCIFHGCQIFSRDGIFAELQSVVLQKIFLASQFYPSKFNVFLLFYNHFI